MTDQPAVDPSLFPLDPDTTFLNHGSFGSCPLAVLEHQQELRMRLERQPVQFYQREFEPLLDQARASIGSFANANADDLVFVTNTTAGVNTVVRSLPFQKGDELLVTNHEYNACANALRVAAEKRGAKVVTIEIPFPIKNEQQAIDAVLAKVTDKTRLLLIDHVTSQSALVLPIKPIVDALNERGIDTLVDGSHAPGMVPVDIETLGAAYYTANCHKWLCAPKTAGFLHVRKDKQNTIRPLTISHGANSPRMDRSRMLIEFGWMGTRDPSAALSIPFLIDYMSKRLPGGWEEIRRRNRDLAIAGRKVILESLNLEEPAPENMLGSMATIPLSHSTLREPYQSLRYQSPWQERLIVDYAIEVPLFPWMDFPDHVVRISAQVYNRLDDYRKLADALKEFSR
jgi:isopenicillin-N epimerase